MLRSDRRVHHATRCRFLAQGRQAARLGLRAGSWLLRVAAWLLGGTVLLVGGIVAIGWATGAMTVRLPLPSSPLAAPDSVRASADPRAATSGGRTRRSRSTRTQRARHLAQRARAQARLACAAAPRTADDAQELLLLLARSQVLPVPLDAASRVVVVTVRAPLSLAFPRAATILPLPAGRALLLFGEPAPGHSPTPFVVHEVVHLGQFSRDRAARRALLDSLTLADRAERDVLAHDVRDAWSSMALLLTAGRSATVRDQLTAQVLAHPRLEHPLALGEGRVARLADAATEVIARPQWRDARRRLQVAAWLAAPHTADGDVWSWRDALRQHLHWETMAYVAARRCGNLP